jgi:hypothetical protein
VAIRGMRGTAQGEIVRNMAKKGRGRGAHAGHTPASLRSMQPPTSHVHARGVAGVRGSGLTRTTSPCYLLPLTFCPDAAQALEKYNIEKDVAAFIKKEFDKKYNPTWHCIVGRNFGEWARAPNWGAVCEAHTTPLGG